MVPKPEAAVAVPVFKAVKAMQQVAVQVVPGESVALLAQLSPMQQAVVVVAEHMLVVPVVAAI